MEDLSGPCVWMWTMGYIYHVCTFYIPFHSRHSSRLENQIKIMLVINIKIYLNLHFPPQPQGEWREPSIKEGGFFVSVFPKLTSYNLPNPCIKLWRRRVLSCFQSRVIIFSIKDVFTNIYSGIGNNRTFAEMKKFKLTFFNSFLVFFIYHLLFPRFSWEHRMVINSINVHF